MFLAWILPVCPQNKPDLLSLLLYIQGQPLLHLQEWYIYNSLCPYYYNYYVIRGTYVCVDSSLTIY